MKPKLLLPVAVVAALALAACDNKPAEPAADAATPAATAPAAAPAEQPAPEAAAPPATPAATPMTPEAAMQAIQQQAASMTPEQKQQAVEAGRKTAEDAARAQGLSDEQVKQAGDLAEQTLKQTLGVQ